MLSCNPLVLVRHLPQPSKLMLNIDSSGWWDFTAVVFPQGKRLKWWSYAFLGEKVNIPSASYTSLFLGPPAAQLTLGSPRSPWREHRAPGNVQAPAPAMCGQDGSCAFGQWHPVSALVCLCSFLLIISLGWLSLLLLPECAILATTSFMKSKGES